MTDGAPPISLAGAQLGATRHVCAFFSSDDEEYRVLLPFMKEGFDCGHKAVHVVNSGQRDAHLRRLGVAGIDLTTAQRRGQLDLHSNTDVYLRDGQFDQDRMLEVMGPSLVVTAITEDQGFIDQLIDSANIDRLNIGPLPTSRVQWDQPHEGNLFEFLYRRRAIQRA